MEDKKPTSGKTPVEVTKSPAAPSKEDVMFGDTRLGKVTTSTTKVDEEVVALQKEMEVILDENGRMESNIPVSSAYWDLRNRLQYLVKQSAMTVAGKL